MRNQSVGTGARSLRSAIRNSIGAVTCAVALLMIQPAFANNDAPKAPAPKRGLQAAVQPTADPLRVYVSALPQENKKLRVALVNQRNNIFYEGLYWKPEGYRRAFNLAELADGTYTFLIESGDQQIKHTFTIATENIRKVLTH